MWLRNQKENAGVQRRGGEKVNLPFNMTCEQLKSCNLFIFFIKSHHGKNKYINKQPGFLFSIFDLLTSSRPPVLKSPLKHQKIDALCEDFVEHLRSQINDVKYSISAHQNIINLDSDFFFTWGNTEKWLMQGHLVDFSPR